MHDESILFDASRLIWRQWTRRLPTGIDRVCLAYLEHFHPRARAVIQFRQFRRLLDRKGSARLFELLLSGSSRFRSELVTTLMATAVRTETSNTGQVYLNVGHTGLNSPHIGSWLSERGLRPVFLIHDLIPITHPQYCREGESARHQLRMETALRSASGLIFNSAATQHDLTQFASGHGIAMPNSLIAWLGTNTATTTPPADKGPSKRPYFAMIGTIEARKNHLLLLEVWREIVGRLGDQAPDLIVIGQRGWEAAEAIAILDNPGPLGGHVRELAGCDDDQRGRILAGARAMLMPSFIEGFGLPVIESLQQGVPVIASDLPVFREIAGDIPTYLDPYDRAAWINTIIGYSIDGTERKRQLSEIAGFKAPTWVNHFSLIEDFLENL